MNDEPVSRGTRPRVMAYANGEKVEGLVSFDVDNNSFYEADTFRVTLCLSAQPANRDWNWWSQQSEIEMEILAGYPEDPAAYDRADLVSLVVGNVDDIEIDPIRDEITMAGRDLTSVFIDNKTIEKYQNLTASQVATKLALSHGLTPVVVDTQGTVGSYYQIDHVAVQDDRPEWDVLTYLANVTGNVVYVKGRELHFEPRAGSEEKLITPAPADKDAIQKELDQVRAEWAAEIDKGKAFNQQASADADRMVAARNNGDTAGAAAARQAGNENVAKATSTLDAARAKYKQREADLVAKLAKPDAAPYLQTNAYVIRWQPRSAEQASPVLNAVTLSVSRNLSIAKDVKVTVRSWNQKQKKGFTVTANRVRVKNKATARVARSPGPPQHYSFFFPNLTPEEAQVKANKLLKDISEHEMNLNSEVPGDPALTPQVEIRLEGTATAFDQLFYPASVTHSYDEGSGYRTSVRAKNSSPESTVMP